MVLNLGKPKNNNSNNNSVSSDSLEDKLADIPIATMKEIVKDNEDRVLNKNYLEFLKKGVFFPTQYYSLLKLNYSFLKEQEYLVLKLNNSPSSPSKFELVNEPH